ncbi:MAG: PilZ domain-containing protein [Solirubrobacterales bacterium]
MSDNFKIYKNGEYVYINRGKRFGERVELNLDIFYPIVNNESIHEKYKNDEAFLRIINISKSGVLLWSKIPLQVGDYVNFLVKIEDNPSFWCLVLVKRIEVKENAFYAGCEFYSLGMNEINQINKFVEKTL